MELWELRQKQSLLLEAKIIMSQERIRQWHEHYEGQVYVSFSGGKDSTVLLHLVRQMYPDVPAVFADTGLEYPEIRDFVKTVDNVVWLKPKMTFNQVINKYGYPVISKESSQAIYQVKNYKLSAGYLQRILYGNSPTNKGRRKISQKWQYLLRAPFRISHKCCDVIKKAPIKIFEKQTGLRAIVGTMAGESKQRESHYLSEGCNAFDNKRPQSKPLSFWTKQDVWDYIHKFNIPYSKIYDMGYTRTGCMFCMFGVHLEQEPNRFQRMKYTHPKQWEYCMFKLGLAEVLNYIKVPWGGQMELGDYLEVKAK